MPWTIPLGQLLLACAALARSDQGRALSLFGPAEAGFRRADMALYAAAARRRQGELLGGDQGRAQLAEVDSWMQAQDIVNPRRMVSLLAPGPR